MHTATKHCATIHKYSFSSRDERRASFLHLLVIVFGIVVVALRSARWISNWIAETGATNDATGYPYYYHFPYLIYIYDHLDI